MKEATGELSTTVITVVAIAAISALFITFLYPQLKASIILNQACSNGPGYKYLADDKSYTVYCGSVASGATTRTYTCAYQSGTGLSQLTSLTGTGVRTKECSNGQ